MARAMKLGVEAGRLAYLAGRMDKKYYARASSPLEQISKLLDNN
jgi:thiazole synthase